MDRSLMIYHIASLTLGNYRTEKGLALIQKLQEKSNAELKHRLEQLKKRKANNAK